MKVTFYLENGAEKRAVVSLNDDNSIAGIICEDTLYTEHSLFVKNYPYVTFVTSDPGVEHWLAAHNFTVRPAGRINEQLHIMLPEWILSELDRLCRVKYFNYSRSDLINYILFKNLDHIPPKCFYEKNMKKTTFTCNPIICQKLEHLERQLGSTRTHLIYDYISEFLDGR